MRTFRSLLPALYHDHNPKIHGCMDEFGVGLNAGRRAKLLPPEIGIVDLIQKG